VVAKEIGLPVEERYLLPFDLLHADEAMITSSVREIVPVVRVGVNGDEHAIGNGAVGPVVKQITKAFRAHARRSVGLV
jgi:branched-chain amino acid aminotransferase